MYRHLDAANIAPAQRCAVEIVGIKDARIPVFLIHSLTGLLSARDLGLSADIPECTLLICHPDLTVSVGGTVIDDRMNLGFIEKDVKLRAIVYNGTGRALPEWIVTGYNPFAKVGRVNKGLAPKSGV